MARLTLGYLAWDISSFSSTVDPKPICEGDLPQFLNPPSEFHVVANFPPII